MTDPNPLGFGLPPRLHGDDTRIEQVLVEHQLQRVLAFTGLTIDDVLSSPVARNTVLGFYRASRWIDRQCEVNELEQQWNALRV